MPLHNALGGREERGERERVRVKEGGGRGRERESMIYTTSVACLSKLFFGGSNVLYFS
jgi:hypothetical protein